MLKCQLCWRSVAFHAPALRYAIFDHPAGHTSWEVMRWSSGGAPQEQARILQCVICFFEFFAGAARSFVVVFFQADNNRGES